MTESAVTNTATVLFNTVVHKHVSSKFARADESLITVGDGATISSWSVCGVSFHSASFVLLPGASTTSFCRHLDWLCVDHRTCSLRCGDRG